MFSLTKQRCALFSRKTRLPYMRFSTKLVGPAQHQGDTAPESHVRNWCFPEGTKEASQRPHTQRDPLARRPPEQLS